MSGKMGMRARRSMGVSSEELEIQLPRIGDAARARDAEERRMFRRAQPTPVDEGTTKREQEGHKLRSAAMHCQMNPAPVQLIAIDGLEYCIMPASCKSRWYSGCIFALKVGGDRVRMTAEYDLRSTTNFCRSVEEALGVTLRELAKKR